MILVKKIGILELQIAIVIPDDAMMNNDALTSTFAIASSKGMMFIIARKQIRRIVVIDIGSASVIHTTKAAKSKKMPLIAICGRTGIISIPKESAIRIPARIRLYCFFLEILITALLPAFK